MAWGRRWQERGTHITGSVNILQEPSCPIKRGSFLEFCLIYIVVGGKCLTLCVCFWVRSFEAFHKLTLSCATLHRQTKPSIKNHGNPLENYRIGFRRLTPDSLFMTNSRSPAQAWTTCGCLGSTNIIWCTSAVAPPPMGAPICTTLRGISANPFRRSADPARFPSSSSSVSSSSLCDTSVSSP